MSGIQDVAREAGLKPELVANIFEAILHAVSRGEKVRIKGIGTFERKLYKGRTLVTPAVNDGDPIKYPDSYVLKFHQSQLAKRRINIVAKKQADAEPKTSKKEKKAAAEATKPAKKGKAKPHPEDNPVKLKQSVPPPVAAEAQKKKKKPRAPEPGEEE
jgi:nucleoid DNA-binding protein